MDDDLSFDNLPPLGDWLRRERERLRLSVRELARRAGISHASLSYIENGVNGVRRENALKLIEALLMDVVDPAERERISRELLHVAGFALPTTGPPDIETVLEHIAGYAEFDRVEREAIREAAIHAGRIVAQTLRKFHPRTVLPQAGSESDAPDEDMKRMI